MWITALQPQALEKEIVQVNRQKVVIYGIFEQLENKKIELQAVAKSCQNNEAEILQNAENQRKKWQSSQTQINNYKTQIHTIEEQIQQSPISQSRLLVKKLAVSSQDYLQNLSQLKNQKILHGQLIANWQVLVNKFCVSGIETQSKMLPELEKTLVKLSEFQGLENWQKNNEEWLKCAQSLVKNKWNENAEKPEIKKEIDDWKAKTAKVFELEITKLNLGQEFINNLKELENWEAEQVQNVPKIESSLIFFVGRK